MLRDRICVMVARACNIKSKAIFHSDLLKVTRKWQDNCLSWPQNEMLELWWGWVTQQLLDIQQAEIVCSLWDRRDSFDPSVDAGWHLANLPDLWLSLTLWPASTVRAIKKMVKGYTGHKSGMNWSGMWHWYNMLIRAATSNTGSHLLKRRSQFWVANM